MTTEDFNQDLTALVKRAIRHGIKRNLTSLPALAGVLQTHAQEMLKTHSELSGRLPR